MQWLWLLIQSVPWRDARSPVADRTFAAEIHQLTASRKEVHLATGGARPTGQLATPRFVRG
ncbi:uncharacterized protein AFUA_1G03240 [Aspergillus fumigatus Af293]|uniref:Uncharacterized protein n=2 Tax=Aspergillus fumigatus TaxID=746128 RepID=Q4WK96_ASPFU|nr:hypothetical protein AFUA_1G03240 [Aspergillus fumigatus Af293]EAL88036.1 hypothetical protein AFUA_1G03240 [Aspergillus fumigatus Af293]EDP55669.1 hypothetical protein AFUB_003660 [Aspergillus fumigatus A1163]